MILDSFGIIISLYDILKPASDFSKRDLFFFDIHIFMLILYSCLYPCNHFLLCLYNISWKEITCILLELLIQAFARKSNGRKMFLVQILYIFIIYMIENNLFVKSLFWVRCSIMKFYHFYRRLSTIQTIHLIQIYPVPKNRFHSLF